MKNHIKINLPVNLQANQSFLFPDAAYEAAKLSVLNITDAFVTKAGIVLKKLRLVKASVHRYNYLYFLYYKVALGNYFLRKKNRLPSNEKYLIIHNIWSRGYYHWICEALPRLWMVKDSVENLILLLPESYKGFQYASLSGFNFKKIIYFPVNTNFFVSQLVLPSNPAALYQPSPELCSAIRTYYRKQPDEALLKRMNFGEKIYISRKSATIRKVVNEEKLAEVLTTYGFKIVAFEEYSFPEQVAIMFHVRYLISIHGAGLTNMHFMEKGGCTLELYKERVPKVDWGRGLRSDLPSPCYMNLASALDHRYYIQFCKAVDEKIPAGRANLVVDDKEFERNIRNMVSALAT